MRQSGPQLTLRALRLGTAGPPNHHGKRPGGIPLTVMSTLGVVTELAELRFATVLDLKSRVWEATHTVPEQQHLFLADAAGHPVAAIHGFRPSWTWPATQLVVRLENERTLESYGIAAGTTLYLLVKLGVFASMPSFSGNTVVALAAQKFHRLARPSSVRRMSLPDIKNTLDAEALARLEGVPAAGDAGGDPAPPVAT